MNFLDQAQGVVDGKLLIPHWRFPGKGVNMRRMFEEPRTLDPVLFITGSDALPYIEDGPLAPGSTMQTGKALIFGGGLLVYFLWLNRAGSVSQKFVDAGLGPGLGIHLLHDHRAVQVDAAL
jgi:hypothetical protein